jgi:hypothetical protein
LPPHVRQDLKIKLHLQIRFAQHPVVFELARSQIADSQPLCFPLSYFLSQLDTQSDACSLASLSVVEIRSELGCWPGV